MLAVQEPLESKLGPVVGRCMRAAAVERGIVFEMLHEVVAFHGDEQTKRERDGDADNAVVRSVEVQCLTSGTTRRIPCDMVVVGAGIIPNTAYLRSTEGVTLDSDGGVVADEYMKVCDVVPSAPFVCTAQVLGPLMLRFAGRRQCVCGG